MLLLWDKDLFETELVEKNNETAKIHLIFM